MGQILVIIFGSFVAGFLLIFLLALSEKKRRQEKEKSGEPPLKNTFTLEQFEKICIEIVEGMKLTIEEIHRASEGDLDIMAKNPTPFTGGTFLVRCLFLEPHQTISAAEVLELSGTIIQDRISKGIFITTGRFTEDLPTLSELAPIDFVDGAEFCQLVERYAPAYKPVIRS